MGIKDIGGGVAAYMNNVVSYINEHKREYNCEITFLSSGYFYDEKCETYIKRMDDFNGIENYTIVNSHCFAPHQGSNEMYRKMIHDESLLHLLDNFIIEHGQFDVIHFQSLEGLSPNVLKLKEKYPNTLFVHSIHDYGLFCSNVKLWTKRETDCYQESDRNCGACMERCLLLSLKNKIKRRKYANIGMPIPIKYKVVHKVQRVVYHCFTPPLYIKGVCSTTLIKPLQNTETYALIA